MLVCLMPVLRTAVKPDGVHRGLISDIIKRFEQKGYKVGRAREVVQWV